MTTQALANTEITPQEEFHSACQYFASAAVFGTSRYEISEAFENKKNILTDYYRRAQSSHVQMVPKIASSVASKATVGSFLAFTVAIFGLDAIAPGVTAAENLWLIDPATLSTTASSLWYTSYALCTGIWAAGISRAGMAAVQGLANYENKEPFRKLLGPTVVDHQKKLADQSAETPTLPKPTA